MNEDNYEAPELDEAEENIEERCDYERYPLDSSYYEDARFL